MSAVQLNALLVPFQRLQALLACLVLQAAFLTHLLRLAAPTVHLVAFPIRLVLQDVLCVIVRSSNHQQDRHVASTVMEIVYLPQVLPRVCPATKIKMLMMMITAVTSILPTDSVKRMMTIMEMKEIITKEMEEIIREMEEMEETIMIRDTIKISLATIMSYSYVTFSGNVK
jgi:hypothetical protein